MLTRLLLITACVVTSVAAQRVAIGAGLAFAQNFLAGSKQIVSFPVGNPNSMTVIGPQTDTFTGMDFDPRANMLWAINFTTQTVGTVNQTTGVYTPNAALQGGCCIKALTIDPVGGTFYVAKDDQYVYSLDPTSGVTVLAALGATTGVQITALAMDCSGRMFAVDGVSGDIYQVHLNGSPTLVGNPGYMSSTSLEFDNESGVAYIWFNPAASSASTHATLDTATGQVSQSSVVAGRYRMAIRSTCSIFVDGFEG